MKDSKNKEPDVLFIGDSLIARLQQSIVWSELFEPLHCLNFGIGSDTTQNVLWRLENGEIEDIKPKVQWHVLLFALPICSITTLS